MAAVGAAVAKANQSQGSRMTIWCLLVIALVAIVIAIGFAMFYMPGRSAPEEKRSPSPATSAQ